MDDKTLFKGFDETTQARHEDWLADRFGGDMRQRIEQSKAGLKGLGQEELGRLIGEAEAVETGMVEALSRSLDVGAAEVQALMSRHHAWVARMWSRQPNAEQYAGLGRLYQEHPEFRARYEARAPGLTDYYAEAMAAYAERALG